MMGGTGSSRQVFAGASHPLIVSSFFIHLFFTCLCPFLSSLSSWEDEYEEYLGRSWKKI
jgi:hypothetical protein